jgi:imidazolonepropionase
MREIGIVDRGAVGVSQGKIISVAPFEVIAQTIECDNVVDAGSCVVCPGFIDPHTHIVFAGDRLDEFEMKIAGADYLEILANGGGILSTVERTREAPFDRLVEDAARRLDKMLGCGTTTVEIKTGYGLDLETELKMLQVIEQLDKVHAVDVIPTLLAAHAVPREFKENPDDYVTAVCNQILPIAWDWYQRSHFMGNGIPFFLDVFCERNAFNIEQSRRIIDRSQEFGYSIKAHVDEFTNLGGSRLAIASKAVSIDHLDKISVEEVELLSGSNTIGVITPTVNFNMGSCEFANARALLDSGCAIALSTDFNPGSAPSPSQPITMAIATRYQKMLPTEAINAVTINAAHAVAMGSAYGSIEIGKAADILILDVKDYREIIYEFGAPAINSVFKKGRLVFDRGECLLT